MGDLYVLLGNPNVVSHFVLEIWHFPAFLSVQAVPSNTWEDHPRTGGPVLRSNHVDWWNWSDGGQRVNLLFFL